ncbi:MAG: hypothetical protein RLZZ623_2629 [Actinomycetota bacterium]
MAEQSIPAPTDELIAELEAALATARQQQRLLRGSLTTLIGFLDRPQR